MYLSYCAKRALIGLSYIYTVKLIDTLWHGIFAYPALALSIVSLSILAGIAQLLFFIELRSVTRRRGLSSRAGWLGVIGSCFTILPKILALAVLLHHEFLYIFLQKGTIIALLSPWIGAASLFSCCVMFSRSPQKLRHHEIQAFYSGILAYFVLAALFSLQILNYFSGTEINWQAGEIGTDLTLFIISISFSFICHIYFYTRFFGEKSIVSNDFSHHDCSHMSR